MTEKKSVETNELKPLLSLKEMAQYLGMGYKAVWRLVLAGELPASKIGGVYRIKRDDAERFFEQQKVKTVARDISVPADDRDAASQTETVSERAATTCARCLRIIKTAEMVGGECEDPSCESLLCRMCWASESDRFCLEHKPSPETKLAEARRRLKAGEITVVVTSDQAYLREVKFINRFDQKVKGISSIRSPVDGSKISVSSWGDIHQTHSDHMEPSSSSAARRGSGETFPRNLWSSYHLSKRGKKGNGGFVLAATVFSHLHKYSEYGFDTQPVSRSELAWLLQGLVIQARVSHCLYVVCIASPTGWEQEARESISGGENERSFSDLNLVPCLFDLQTNQLIHNTHDTRLKSIVPFFRGDFDEEVIDKAIAFINDKLAEKDPLLLKDIVKEMSVSKDQVEEAFKMLEAGGDFTVVKVDKLGLAISRHS